MPHRPTPRLISLTAASATTVLITGVLSAAPVHAAPCQNPQNLICNPVSDGSSTGGTGGSGGGSGGGIPTIGGDDQGFAGGVNDPIPAAPQRTTVDLAEEARGLAELPVPAAHTAPSEKTYVRIRTALWVEGFATVSTPPVSAGAQTVQATATPKSVTWSLGDRTLSCNGPGRPNSTACSHVYQRSSTGQPGGAYRITATITWSVHWTCEGAACTALEGDLEDMTMTSQPTPLIVSEIQTNTRQ